MTNPTVKIHDMATDEIIEREMTADELAQFEADKVERATIAAAEAKAAADKAALLAKLGISESEAKLLLS
jgi:hypothetical protein